MQKTNMMEMLPILQGMMIELATQHVLGIVQRDLHLKNFLITEKRIYTIDGAEIKFIKHLLPKKLSMENLALFFSQFGIDLINYYEQLFKMYIKARGWILKDRDMHDLRMMIAAHNAERWQQYSKKIYRNATDFLQIKRWNSFAMINRKYMHPIFEKFFLDPESLFNNMQHVVLKAGRSNTVIKISIADREFVIKRYNRKNLWHFLRRAFKPTRAYTTWRMVHKLILFGVPTATPVAFLEKRYFGLRTVSYSIAEYIKSGDAKQFFTTHPTDDVQTIHLIQSISVLLKSFAELRVTHGDLKLTNILINQQFQPIIIDLDGTQEHQSNLILQRTYRKEIKRFLRNFADQPYLQNQFAKELSTCKA